MQVEEHSGVAVSQDLVRVCEIVGVVPHGKSGAQGDQVSTDITSVEICTY